LEMQRSIMHTTLLCTEESCGHPHKKLLIHLYEFMLLRSKGYYVLLRAEWFHPLLLSSISFLT